LELERERERKALPRKERRKKNGHKEEKKEANEKGKI
jgi:hypothetical protein